MLPHEPDACEPGRTDANVEVVAVPGGVLDVDLRVRERRDQAGAKVLDGNHLRRATRPAHLTQAAARRQFGAQVIVGSELLSKVQLWFAFGCSAVIRKPAASPLHSVNWTPGEGVKPGSEMQLLE